LRKLAKENHTISLVSAGQLLKSEFHEERLLALLILMMQYRKTDEAGKEKIYQLYISNTAYINNWDLVDVTAKHIVGAFLMDKSKALLYKFAQSPLLWERRIAIIATFYFIDQHAFDDTLNIAEMLLEDKEDLMHKAVGWMLREVGKKNLRSEEKFLKKHYTRMPRTMLRYAIEKFPKRKRLSYLKGRI
jgi:3-methyladenine DNA glycosylase AlkD